MKWMLICLCRKIQYITLILCVYVLVFRWHSGRSLWTASGLVSVMSARARGRCPPSQTLSRASSDALTHTHEVQYTSHNTHSASSDTHHNTQTHTHTHITTHMHTLTREHVHTHTHAHTHTHQMWCPETFRLHLHSNLSHNALRV